MAQIILSGSGTWNLPSNWNDADNTIEMYGSGANGETTTSTARSGYGGGGGGYVKAVNVPLKNYESIATGGQYFAKTYSTTGYNGGLWNGVVSTIDGFVGTQGPLVHGGGGYACSVGTARTRSLQIKSVPAPRQSPLNASSNSHVGRPIFGAARDEWRWT